MLENFRLLYWTRLMKVDDFESGLDRKWPMGPDIVEECRTVSNFQLSDQVRWTPFFDPDEFNKTNGPLLVKDYSLPQADLKQWVERAVTLRQAIVEKAKLFEEPEESSVEDQVHQRTRVG